MTKPKVKVIEKTIEEENVIPDRLAKPTVKMIVIGEPGEEVKILPDLLDRVALVIRESLEGYEKGKWKETIEIQYLRRQGYTKPQIKVIWRINYCDYYKIPYNGRTKDKQYKSFNSHLDRIVDVGCLGEKEFDAYLKSGMSVNAVWEEEKRKKVKHEKVKPETLRQLEQEAAEGVENAAELLKGVKMSKKTKSKEIDEGPSSWTATQKTLDHEWIMECRKIIRDDPRLFIRMIESLKTSDLLSNDTLESVKTDLKLL